MRDEDIRCPRCGSSNHDSIEDNIDDIFASVDAFEKPFVFTREFQCADCYTNFVHKVEFAFEDKGLSIIED